MAAVNPLEENELSNPLFSQRLPLSVLVVDGEVDVCTFLQKALVRDCGHVDVAKDVERAEQLRERCHFDVIVIDVSLGGSAIEWVETLHAQGSTSDVIFTTDSADVAVAITALRAGAADLLLKPFQPEQVLTAVKRCWERRSLSRENFVLKRELGHGHLLLEGIVGRSPAIKEVCDIVHRIAPTAATLLIEGESGTGKELAARSLHKFSKRSGPFVPINCGSISGELLESELFGHVKGAFTGAHQTHQGLFSYAHEGTLFLDEIGEMPLAMQAKLLRVLEERAIRPVGAEREIPVDVRIVAATNRNLVEEVRQGNFREDLFYRLNVITVRMPGLAERKDDIPLLVEHFARTLSGQLGLAPMPLQSADVIRLQDYHWPGNIRELKNVMERSLLLQKKPHQCLNCANPLPTDDSSSMEPHYPLDWPLEAVERHHMRRVLDAFSGNKSEAARRLGVSRKTLERKFQ